MVHILILHLKTLQWNKEIIDTGFDTTKWHATKYLRLYEYDYRSYSNVNNRKMKL